MVHALIQRWNGFQSVRELLKNPPTVDVDECPFCLDSDASYEWSNETTYWKEECVTTACKHRFCTKCWNHNTDKELQIFIRCMGVSLIRSTYVTHCAYMK